MRKVIAIDGPAGSGKGTIARELASYFKFKYIDTGMLYRVVAYLKQTPDSLKNFTLQKLLDARKKISDKELRSPENSQNTSLVSQNSEIRNLITKMVQDHIDNSEDGFVLDGRDIGTVVAPDAFCKIFLTADSEVRAYRRFVQQSKSDPNLTLEKVLENINLRDHQDMTRDVAPLRYDESYIKVDTSGKAVKQSMKECLNIVKNAMQKNLES
ncbi:MAG: (d)CMP kinase [Alphaproteobacteria bacterium]|nr:(d)CMP kinase [Alphaproteobacteria bacterium]